MSPLEKNAYRDWAEYLLNCIEDKENDKFMCSLRPKNLHDFIESEAFSESISNEVDKSRGEIFLMALKFSISNYLSTTATSNLFTLINNIFRTPILPNSKYIHDKLLNPNIGVSFHAVCNTCSVYIGEFSEVKNIKNCHICSSNLLLSNTSDSSFFVLLDPTKQVSDLIHIHEDHYDYVVKERIPEENYIQDVYDGNEYRKFVNSLPEKDKHCYVTSVLNTDGAPIYKSSKYSIWPIFLKLNELPAQERSNNLILAGLWFNKNKPDMTVFLGRFVELLNRVTDAGIRCLIKEEERILKLFVNNCCCDAVARAPIQGVKQYNGSFGCNWCLHPGEYKEGSMKYPYIIPAPEPRCHDNMVRVMMEDTSNTPFGIKHTSPLINVHSFNLVSGFVPDYLHSCLEGVGVQFTSYFLEGKNDTDIAELDKIMENIAVPQQLQRLCRPLSNRKEYKAREWENFILYYSPIVFSTILSKKHLIHWLLFVESLYIILGDKIHINELNRADEMLHLFVHQSRELYGDRSMTYNLHQCLHLCMSVLNWGPLWTNSTFCFESANYNILRAIKCAKGVTHQVIRYVNILHSILLLENRMLGKISVDVVNYCNDVLTAKIKNVTRRCNITFFGNGEELDFDILRKIQQQIDISDNTRIYYKIVKDRCLYESYLVSKNRSNNAFASLQDGTIVKIYGFLVDPSNEDVLLMSNLVHTKKLNIPYRFMLMIDNIEHIFTIIPVSWIKKICVALCITDKTYISSLPNMLHY